MSDRIKIRCPNCHKDGSCRAESTNRRVSCKHCKFVFRAIPVDDNASSSRPADSAVKNPSRLRVDALQEEIRRLRDDLSAEQAAVGEIDRLRDQLAQALDAARNAEAREQAARKEAEELRDRAAPAGDEGKNSLREEELRFLRVQLDKARGEAESEGRRRRETASILSTRTAEYGETITALKADHAKALKAKEDEQSRALATKESQHTEALRARADELARALKVKEDEHAKGLDARSAEHARALQGLRDQLNRARAEAENRRDDEVRAVRNELEAARSAQDGLRHDRDLAEAEHARLVEELNGRLARAEAGLADSDATRADRDRVARELGEARADRDRIAWELGEVRADRDRVAWELGEVRARLDEVERQAAEHRDGAESARSAEVADLREEIDRARAEASEAEAYRRDRDEARAQRDRFSEQLNALQERLAEADQRVAELAFASTEMEVPQALESTEMQALQGDDSTVYDDGMESLRAESDRFRAEAAALRAELTETADRLALKDAALADLARERDRVEALAHENTEAERARAEAEALRRELEQARAATRANGKAEVEKVAQQARAEADVLRRELEQARSAAEAASRSNQELATRIKALEVSLPAPPTTTSGAVADPAAFEAERKRAVDEAVKGAWADFERRLAETQNKLRAANSRADMLEAEAREAREQAAARERGLDLGDGSSFSESQSITTIRILDDRGTARLTQSEAEARLALARLLAVDRKDRSLIDRIAKMAVKVHDDLEARNHTLAETLLRGAEIEVGLDPGGFSISGQRIFRASPTVVNNLAALAPAFDRVMRQGDLAVIRQTIDEMKTILGDQAGLPEIRRPGRTPAIKRPIAEAEALRLFVGALEGENWLIRPISIKKPLPDTALPTYAALIEACCDARNSAERHAPERLPLLQSIIQAAVLMLTRRQQADGHFSFLDPRGKASKLASIVDGMVAQRPDAVKDGWVIHVDPLGIAQVETSACALALASAGKALGKPDWTQAAMKAADWSMGQPVLPSFIANAASASLLAHAYLDAKQDRHLAGLTRKLTLGLLPGQVENGRWVDAFSATTPNHLAILRALHDAWEATPADRAESRRELKESIDRAMISLLGECKALGVPAQGNALRDLIRHRNLFRPEIDARVEPAIIDSVTVIQELCHEGPKPKLGVAPDQLAAMMKA